MTKKFKPYISLVKLKTKLNLRKIGNFRVYSILI